MKPFILFPSVLLMIVGISVWSFRSPEPVAADSVVGAWKLATVNGEAPDYAQVALFSKTYCMISAFQLGGQFLATNGGPYSFDGKTLTIQMHFNSQDTTTVGSESKVAITLAGNRATSRQMGGDGPTLVWERMDEAGSPLSGHWQISGRMRNGEMQAIQRNNSPRKTIKMLTGTRFQWTAMNIETGQFHGCGGGTYTFEDGKYTENIEYFSRDNSRVGMSLSFDGKVEGDDWHHSGKSSKGKPISEIWTRQ